jgi:hypothetical protein
VTTAELAAVVQRQYQAAKSRPDVLTFAKSVGFTPEAWQAEFLQCEDPQVILNCHRSAGKSAVVSVLALHRMVTIPNYEILVLSRNDAAAMELSYNLKRTLMQIEPKPQVLDMNKHQIVLGNGSRLTVSPCTEPRGYHVNMMIEDEASYVPHEVYMAARPVVVAKKGRYLMLSTPKGKVGHFYDVWSSQPNWRKIKATWKDTKRYTPEQLARIERDKVEMGDAWFNQEWNCEFLEATGQLIAEVHIEKAFAEEVKQDDMGDVVW